MSYYRVCSSACTFCLLKNKKKTFLPQLLQVRGLKKARYTFLPEVHHFTRGTPFYRRYTFLPEVHLFSVGTPFLAQVVPVLHLFPPPFPWVPSLFMVRSFWGCLWVVDVEGHPVPHFRMGNIIIDGWIDR